jgi:hypothetical protein
MPKHTKILNKKLYIIVFLLFMFYGLITALAAYYTYSNYLLYGVYTSMTTQVNFVSDFYINLSITILLLITAIVLLACASQNTITLDYQPSKTDTGNYGIDFPNGRPEHWDISANIETQSLEVNLNGSIVSVSKETIDNLFKGVVKKVE